MKNLLDLSPFSVKLSHTAHSLARNNEKNFGNNSRQAPSPDFGAETVPFSLETSCSAESECLTSTDVTGVCLYFGMFVALNTLESFNICPKVDFFGDRQSTVFIKDRLKVRTNVLKSLSASAIVS